MSNLIKSCAVLQHFSNIIKFFYSLLFEETDYSSKLLDLIYLTFFIIIMIGLYYLYNRTIKHYEIMVKSDKIFYGSIEILVDNIILFVVYLEYYNFFEFEPTTIYEIFYLNFIFTLIIDVSIIYIIVTLFNINNSVNLLHLVSHLFFWLIGIYLISFYMIILILCFHVINFYKSDIKDNGKFNHEKYLREVPKFKEGRRKYYTLCSE